MMDTLLLLSLLLAIEAPVALHQLVVTPSIQEHHRFVVGLGQHRWGVGVRVEGEVEDVGEGGSVGDGIHHAGLGAQLHVPAVRVHNLRVKVEQGADLDRLLEGDVIDVADPGALTANEAGIDPGQLEGLTH